MLVKCEVNQSRYGSINVTFPGSPGKSLFMQSDIDQAAFAYACGLISESDPALLPDVDLEDITKCPDDYLYIATEDME